MGIPKDWLSLALEAVNVIFGFGTKAIKPDEVRIRNSQISEPKQVRKISEWIEGKDIEGWAARIKTFDLKRRGKRKTVTQKELIKYVSEIIEWGADIQDIRKTETEVQVDYCRDAISYPTEIFKL